MKHLSSPIWYILAGIAGLLLLSMIAFPLGLDQSIFEVGGSLVAKKGAIPYRDFFELKQPLIFYIYSLSTFLFGRHEWSIRLLDALYHLGALLIFYRILRSVYKDEGIALTAILLYVAYYCGTGFWMTAEPESFALLPQIILIWMMVKNESDEKSNPIILSLISAFCLWILVTMKITLVLIGGIVLLYALLFPNSRRKKTYLLGCVAFSIVLIGITAILLSSVDALGNMILTFDWLKQYASHYPILSIETFREFYSKMFIWQLAVAYSPVYLLLALMALARSGPSILTLNDTKSPREIFRSLCFFSAIINLTAVCIERKGFNYHFTRAAWSLVPFAAETIIEFISYTRSQWQKYAAGYQKAIFSIGILIITILIFLLSPLPRIVDQSIGWVSISLRNDVAARNAKINQSNYDVTEMESLAVKYGPSLSAQDNIFVWGNSAQLYYFFDRLPTTVTLVNVLFATSNTPTKWMDKLTQQLYENPPKIFICEYNDYRPLITGTAEDSFESLQHNSVLKNFLASKYSISDSTTHFKIYLRINQ
jgi:hypothetical protein